MPLNLKPLLSDCWGISLKTECLIVGILQLIGGGLAFGILTKRLLNHSVSFILLDQLEGALCQNETLVDKLQLKDACGNFPTVHWRFEVMWILLLIWTITLLLFLIAGSLLVLATSFEMLSLMSGWPYVTLFFIFVGCVLNCIWILLLHTCDVPFTIAGMVASFCINSYFIWILSLLREELLDEAKARLKAQILSSISKIKINLVQDPTLHGVQTEVFIDDAEKSDDV